MPVDEAVTIFSISVSTLVTADAAEVYRYVTDLSRSGEWSPECQGGEWISGEPASPGAVFRGRNRRAEDVVAWAPVVRGEWVTECEVVQAQPHTLFSWAMRDSSGRAQESVWTFRIGRTATGVVLSHEFVMRSLTEGMNGIFAALSQADQHRFIDEWATKLQRDMTATLAAIKRIIEGRASR
jgi:hypothetical protein